MGGLLATLLGVSTGTALAHNSLVSSDPADGATLAVAPTQIVWVFDKSVPLDTLTVTLTDSSGARSELAGSVHGAAGDTEVVTPLPVVPPGVVSVRWRLVGPDGHPVSGRVELTIAQPAVSAAPGVATATYRQRPRGPLSTKPTEHILDPVVRAMDPAVQLVPRDHGGGRDPADERLRLGRCRNAPAAAPNP